MSNDFDAVLRKLALEAAEEVTADNGRIHLAEFHASLDGRIRQIPELYDAAIYKTAQSVARDFGERRSPRRHRKTGGLYHPKSILRLGQGIWVWMKDATPTDTTQWASVSSRNTVRVIAAEAEKQQYALDRTDAFRENPTCGRLAQLEENVFHYQQGTLDDLAFDEPQSARTRRRSIGLGDAEQGFSIPPATARLHLQIPAPCTGHRTPTGLK
ncbi:hypothetical protein [Streptomyces sp. H39-C1]|uniref:hypothetical protein n=1 Tax=Streptomyces sp. H39-C1 TaxID=3004355 RepID=UPI0022AE87DA|nr:hypothetical protein [Streptomyces sp. H39-C1]MCZ4103458.1 hypothetical protein [Streptomyces sp. H39-C1]